MERLLDENKILRSRIEMLELENADHQIKQQQLKRINQALLLSLNNLNSESDRHRLIEDIKSIINNQDKTRTHNTSTTESEREQLIADIKKQIYSQMAQSKSILTVKDENKGRCSFDIQSLKQERAEQPITKSTVFSPKHCQPIQNCTASQIFSKKRSPFQKRRSPQKETKCNQNIRVMQFMKCDNCGLDYTNCQFLQHYQGCKAALRKDKQENANISLLQNKKQMEALKKLIHEKIELENNLSKVKERQNRKQDNNRLETSEIMFVIKTREKMPNSPKNSMNSPKSKLFKNKTSLKNSYM